MKIELDHLGIFKSNNELKYVFWFRNNGIVVALIWRFWLCYKSNKTGCILTACGIAIVCIIKNQLWFQKWKSKKKNKTNKVPLWYLIFRPHKDASLSSEQSYWFMYQPAFITLHLKCFASLQNGCLTGPKVIKGVLVLLLLCKTEKSPSYLQASEHWQLFNKRYFILPPCLGSWG